MRRKVGRTILGLGETTVVDIIGQDSTVPQLLTTSHTWLSLLLTIVTDFVV